MISKHNLKQHKTNRSQSVYQHTVCTKQYCTRTPGVSIIHNFTIHAINNMIIATAPWIGSTKDTINHPSTSPRTENDNNKSYTALSRLLLHKLHQKFQANDTGTSFIVSIFKSTLTIVIISNTTKGKMVNRNSYHTQN